MVCKMYLVLRCCSMPICFLSLAEIIVTPEPDSNTGTLFYVTIRNYYSLRTFRAAAGGAALATIQICPNSETTRFISIYCS
jgi:hypothetical protein